MVFTYKETSIMSGSLNLKQFWSFVDEGKVDYVVIHDQSKVLNVHIKAAEGEEEPAVETIVNPGNNEFTEDIAKRNIDIKYQPATLGSSLSGLLVWLPLIIVLFMGMLYISKTSSTARSQCEADSFPDMEEKRLQTVLFSEIAGMTEEKEELTYAIESMKNTERLKLLGARPVKGILLEGPPGVGKTLLAKAVAGEAGMKFLSYAGSDFVEMYVGVGAKRVREMYDEALKNKPCVIFIDEVDALGSARSGNRSGGLQESNQTLVALLERMDGVSSESGILFMAATNRVRGCGKTVLWSDGCRN